MSISSVGGLSSQASPYPPQPETRDAKRLGQDENQEITTITTHCSKKHKHDQSCPHTVSTRPDPRSQARPAPAPGETGSQLDETV